LDVVLICLRDEYANPIQDVLIVTWKTPDGQVHRNEQSLRSPGEDGPE